jgi:isocitrate dehydrogenase
VDIGSAKMADTPEAFDVIVLPNLYGDILSDIAAQIAGSVGLAGSANIGDQCAMFEAIHGSAPRRAGQDMANPSGLLLGAVMMLVHIGQGAVATKVHNAWLKTIEDGIHTGEIFRPKTSKEKVGTAGFRDAVIARLGQKPERLRPVDYSGVPAGGMKLPPLKPRVVEDKVRVGVDLGMNWDGTADDLAAKILPCCEDGLELTMISNRGVKVWPHGQPGTQIVDNWRLRFMRKDGGNVRTSQVIALLDRLNRADMNFTKAQMLHTFGGKPGFSAAQGE